MCRVICFRVNMSSALPLNQRIIFNYAVHFIFFPVSSTGVGGYGGRAEINGKWDI